MIHFRATGRAAYARTDEPLTAGSVGIPVDVSLSADFDGLQSVVVFRSGDTSADVALLGQDVVVPPQVLTGRVLSMGVYASSTDGNTVIPTVWCDVGLIRGSTATEFDPAEPTPGWSAQIQSWAEDAADSATQAASVADSVRADMDEFNESSAVVLDEVRAATTAASAGADNANQAASAANASASAADAATASAIEATGAANTAASAATDAATLATNAAGVATDAAGNADAATAAARQAANDANTATVSANAAASAASAATTDTENATAAARQATADATTATADANTAATTANTAADGANDAAGAANAAASAATTAANQATAAANNANSKANLANTAANNANAATSAANDATTRANAAIDAMGDISEQAVPVMSADVRGGAKIQPDSGLEITDTDNLQVRLALESDGDVRGGLAQVTAKGHAEQVQTTGKNLLPNTATSQTVNGVTFTVNADGSVKVSGTASAFTQFRINATAIVPADGTYTLSGAHSSNCYLRVWGNNASSSMVDDFGDGASFPFSAATNVNIAAYINVRTNATVNDVIYPMIEAGGSKTEWEPYTGGLPSPRPDWEQSIEVVRGRNLLDESILLGATGWQQAPDGSYYGSNANMYSYTYNQDVFGITFEPNTQYAMRVRTRNVTADKKLYFSFSYTDGTYTDATIIDSNSTEWFDLALVSSLGKSVQSFRISYNSNGVCYIADLQLTLGSTPQPYVPYGHVGMEVRQGSTVLSTTPIPLPSRGWVGSLPDGTADVLTLDGAGKCEWELGTWENVIDDSTQATLDSINSQGRAAFVVSPDHAPYTDANAIDNGVMANRLLPSSNNQTFNGYAGIHRRINGSTTEILLGFGVGKFSTLVEAQSWLAENPVTILYPLATPVTEDCGYCEDWPTDIPEGATVTISELDSVGIKYFIDSGVTELARQWHDRIAYERTIATQDALASVAPIEHSPAESNHSVGELITYEGALYRVTAAIARGESIIIGTNVTATTVAEQLAALQ